LQLPLVISANTLDAIIGSLSLDRLEFALDIEFNNFHKFYTQDTNATNDLPGGRVNRQFQSGLCGLVYWLL